MSLFECRNGHIMKSGERTCSKCGGQVHTMDGMTNRELKAEARRDQEQPDDQGGDEE